MKLADGIPTLTCRPIRVYVACPYSINGKTSMDIRQHNFEIVTKLTAKLLKMNLVVFSPITHSHPIQTIGKLTSNDLDFWMAEDLPFVEFCDIVLVMTLPGWQESNGVQSEISFAKTLDKKIYYATFDDEELKIYEED